MALAHAAACEPRRFVKSTFPSTAIRNNTKKPHTGARSLHKTKCFKQTKYREQDAVRPTHYQSTNTDYAIISDVRLIFMITKWFRRSANPREYFCSATDLPFVRPCTKQKGAQEFGKETITPTKISSSAKGYTSMENAHDHGPC